MLLRNPEPTHKQRLKFTPHPQRLISPQSHSFSDAFSVCAQKKLSSRIITHVLRNTKSGGV